MWYPAWYLSLRGTRTLDGSFFHSGFGCLYLRLDFRDSGLPYLYASLGTCLSWSGDRFWTSWLGICLSLFRTWIQNCVSLCGTYLSWHFRVVYIRLELESRLADLLYRTCFGTCLSLPAGQDLRLTWYLYNDGSFQSFALRIHVQFVIARLAPVFTLDFKNDSVKCVES